jgi:hypothetical protein
MKEKRQARKKWQHSHSPIDKSLLNQLTNRLKEMLKEAQNISFREYVTSLSRYDNTILSSIKSTSKPLQANPPIRKRTPTPRAWARSKKEKADLFAEHLADVFTPNDATIDQEISDYLADKLETEENIKLLTPTYLLMYGAVSPS